MARILTYIWGVVVLGVGALWILRPELFSEAAVATTLEAWGAWSFVGYVVLSMVRGVALVPSTPVVLAGGILFPDALWLVLVVSMVGIVLSATLLYRFPGYGGYDAWLESKHPERIADLSVHLVKPRAQWFVALWAVTPVVPTDLICYVAGLVRMPFRSMILGIVIGE
ncbi:MAG TPA: VTT domain-containing protein, partial [Longimicrobiales bacterium]|nr:VTT domain-containing protein [Longimicrobiales bacterium]